MRYLVDHMLRYSAERTPDHAALIDGQLTFTYSDSASQVSSIASSLQASGIKRGDRIAIYLAPSTDLPLAIFGVSMAGAVFVPIHHGLFPDQVAHILQDCGAAALITDCRRLQSLSNVIPMASDLRLAVVKGSTSETDFDLELHDFENVRVASPTRVVEECIEKDLAAILYTSGSTGRPKGVMLSHANVLAGAKIVSEYLSITNRDRLLAALPLSFDAGLNQLTTGVLQGGTTVMIDFRFGREIVRCLADEQITGLAGVPSLWSLLTQPSSGLGKQPLPDLRYVTNTGGALPQTALTQLRETLPKTEVYLMYGLTEAFRSTYLPPAELDRRPASMGKAIPNTEIMVINDSGQRCQPNEIGELVHHGPTVSMGYWGHAELTRKVLRPHPFPQTGHVLAEYVCYSGDLVKRDADGFLFFVGRRDNQIKSAGYRISPTEVEDVICRVAPIRQAAVIGVPDVTLGQHLVAFAIPEEASGTLDTDDILAACSEKLPRYMIPKRLLLVTNLPMTSNGKVNYIKLRESLESESQQPVNGSSADKFRNHSP